MVNNLKWIALEGDILNFLIEKDILDAILLTRRQLYANLPDREYLSRLLQSSTWEPTLCRYFQRYNFSEHGTIRHYIDE